MKKQKENLKDKKSISPSNILQSMLSSEMYYHEILAFLSHREDELVNLTLKTSKNINV